MLFRFRKTKQPEAGAEAYAFEPAQLNPTFIIQGPGVFCGSIAPLQPPQVYYPFIRGPVSGLGGLIYDPLYFTPLMQSS